jgi:hypothetical protein
MAVAARRRPFPARAEPLAPVLWNFLKARRGQINHWPSVIYVAFADSESDGRNVPLTLLHLPEAADRLLGHSLWPRPIFG